MFGVGLAVWSSYIVRRDVALATGPESKSQEEFFVDAADRPDAATFFRKLTPSQRLAMGQNIGRYQDAPLAKLCGILLGDFDPAARRALSDSLISVARAHPDLVADQLSQKGSFQYLGISRALKAVGAPAIPAVAHELSDPLSRKNAENFLVETGPTAIPFVMPFLTGSDVDAQTAAEDTLGKLRDENAVPHILRIYREGTPDQRASAFAAVAAIADPKTEALMAFVLADRLQPISLRTQAALALGRMGNPQGAAELWKFVDDHDSTLRDQVLNALQICGVAALQTPGVPKAFQLAVASHVEGPVADAIIRSDLREPALVLTALRASSGRQTLAADVAELLARPGTAADGEIAEAAIDSLESTEDGRRLLPVLHRDPDLAGFIDRYQG